jgi:hypothetical protein
MAESLHIEVEGDVIIVTLPGTTLRVNYSKPKKSDGLVAFGIHGDKDAGVSQVDFLVRAWRIANDKARGGLYEAAPKWRNRSGLWDGWIGLYGESRREAAAAIGP